jgi:hypothetical protein
MVFAYPVGGIVIVAAGRCALAVEAVAATGAHPTLKHAQRDPAASKRSCFIVSSEYASALAAAAKKCNRDLEIETCATGQSAFLSVSIPHSSIAGEPLFRLIR